MTIGLSDVAMPAGAKSEWFRVEASQAIDLLRNRISDVLSELGVFTKPAELHHALSLDRTLSRQVFKLSRSAEPMASGGLVPSEASLHRFLDAAKGRGIDDEKIQSVVVAFRQFDEMVKKHAGDRVTFNSMVSGVEGVDEEWRAADLQHRRNGFRTMSHALGMQTKTLLQLFVISLTDEGDFQTAVITGWMGLRVLRRLPSIGIHGVALDPIAGSAASACEPLGLSETSNEDLIEGFCSKPLPNLKVTQGVSAAGPWRRISIERPQVGNLGASTLMFGSLYRKVPIGNDPLQMHVSVSNPIEVFLFDVLIDPRIADGGSPVGEGMLGYNLKYAGEIIPLEGDFNPELLGRGAAALATPEVPRYSEMLGAVSQKIGLNLSGFNAWRMRTEYPLYHSTMCMTWAVPIL